MLLGLRTIYPLSSSDFPVHLYNRRQTRLNDNPVDDQAEGVINSSVISDFVRHDAFYSICEVFNKLHSYTTRLVINKKIKPSRLRGVISAIGAFFKGYLFSGAWRKGRVGLVTDLYATFYSISKILQGPVLGWKIKQHCAQRKCFLCAPTKSGLSGLH